MGFTGFGAPGTMESTLRILIILGILIGVTQL